MHHVMMIVPINSNIDEAENVAYENRKKQFERIKIISMRNLQFQNHNGNDDG